MLKIRWSWDRLNFNMGIPIPGKDSVYIETGPSRVNKLQLRQGHVFLASLVKCISCLLYIFLNITIDRNHNLCQLTADCWALASQNFVIGADGIYCDIGCYIWIGLLFIQSPQTHHILDIPYNLTFNTLRPRLMAAIFQTTFSNAFSWMKMYQFQLRFHWSLFPRVKLTIFQHWFIS